MRFEDEDVTSEMYRLMPPPVAGQVIAVSPDIKAPRWPSRLGASLLKWLKANVSQIFILTVTGVIAGVIVALIVAQVHL